MEENKKLYLELQKLREYKNMTQADIANIINFNISSVSHVEIGQKNLSIQSLLKWLNALDINLIKIISDAQHIDYDLLHKALEKDIDINQLINYELKKRE